MKKIISTMLIIAAFLPVMLFARGLSYAHSYGGLRNTGGVHYVRPYTRRDGTQVQGHLSGNPNSGVHCKDNVCS